MHSETDRQSTDRITIREYRDADWSAVCAVHDRAQPDELRGSCDPREFVPLAEEQDDAATGQSWAGEHITRGRDRYSHLRAALQRKASKGTRSAQRQRTAKYWAFL